MALRIAEIPPDIGIQNLAVGAPQSGSAVDVSQNALHILLDDDVPEIQSDAMKIATLGTRELDLPERRRSLGA